MAWTGAAGSAVRRPLALAFALEVALAHAGPEPVALRRDPRPRRRLGPGLSRLRRPRPPAQLPTQVGRLDPFSS